MLYFIYLLRKTAIRPQSVEKYIKNIVSLSKSCIWNNKLYWLVIQGESTIPWNQYAQACHSFGGYGQNFVAVYRGRYRCGLELLSFWYLTAEKFFHHLCPLPWSCANQSAKNIFQDAKYLVTGLWTLIPKIVRLYLVYVTHKAIYKK